MSATGGSLERFQEEGWRTCGGLQNLYKYHRFHTFPAVLLVSILEVTGGPPLEVRSNGSRWKAGEPAVASKIDTSITHFIPSQRKEAGSVILVSILDGGRSVCLR